MMYDEQMFLLRVTLGGAAISFAVAFLMARPVIDGLRKMKFGQKILEIGPKWHMNKQNIPTMGGVIFIAGIFAAMLAVGGLIGLYKDLISVLYWLAAPLLALGYGLVGLMDDYAKIKKKQNAGLTPLQKLVLQVVMATVFISFLRVGSPYLPVLEIPFADARIELPWLLYILFTAFVIVGTDNAVNLTDGLDGLAAGVTLPVALYFAAEAMRIGNFSAAAFAGALAGGLIAFLIFNFHPAKVFMGDTGSLFLGGAVAALAFSLNRPLVLIPVGAVYIWETLSVILQVGYFKLTHGKRIFKMAPFHHHLEMCGWGEKKIVLTFSGATALLCVLTFLFA